MMQRTALPLVCREVMPSKTSCGMASPAAVFSLNPSRPGSIGSASAVSWAKSGRSGS